MSLIRSLSLRLYSYVSCFYSQRPIRVFWINVFRKGSCVFEELVQPALKKPIVYKINISPLLPPFLSFPAHTLSIPIIPFTSWRSPPSCVSCQGREARRGADVPSRHLPAARTRTYTYAQPINHTFLSLALKCRACP